jgi:RNA polymerase sigma-70 factor (ECF subfamily)
VTAIAQAREEFLGMVAEVRPELHRYCARLIGSTIDGEDIVQETLARAFYALAQEPETPNLRPWLFRIAHNAAIDVLKSHGHKLTDARSDVGELIDAQADAPPDPAITRAAVGRFLGLPLRERSAVILKDVLGHSLEEAAATMGTTVLAVKAALVRGRAKLREATAVERPVDHSARAELDRYAALFNRRDWDGIRALIGEDCRLDLVSKATRRGKGVGEYFARYANLDVTMRPGVLDGRLVLAGYGPGATEPAFFVVLGWEAGRLVEIRDFKYVPYIAREAEFSAA